MEAKRKKVYQNLDEQIINPKAEYTISKIQMKAGAYVEHFYWTSVKGRNEPWRPVNLQVFSLRETST